MPEEDKDKTVRFIDDKESGAIAELEGMLHHIGKCCSPLPGEEIAGVVSKGKGIIVHRYNCQNLELVEKDRIMPIQWHARKDKRYTAALEVECIDRVGVSRDILNKVADDKINVLDLRVIARSSDNTAILKIVVEVEDLYELKKIMASISRVGDVLNVFRSGENKTISLLKKKQNNKTKE